VKKIGTAVKKKASPSGRNTGAAKPRGKTVKKVIPRKISNPAAKKTVKPAAATKPVKKSTKFKILIINYEFPPLGGGGGVASYDLAVEWAKHGQVDVLTSSFKGIPRFEKMEGINIHRVKVLSRKSRDAASFISMLSYLFFGFFAGISLIRKNRYQVINTHFAVPCGPLGYVLGKLFRIPNVLSLHGGDIFDPSKKSSPHRSFVFRRVVRFVLNHATRIVAQSSNTKENAVKYYHPKKEIGIIPLPYHTQKIRRFKREQLGLSKDDFIITTVGRVVKRKAYDVLIHALFEVKDPKVKLLILGDGPERKNLQDLANYLGLHERVRFLGFVDNEAKFSYLDASNIFALTSLHEGFGIVFMEAMQCGLPIVCTNYGGQTDFLVNEENALLINVGDFEKCAASIERFMTDKKLYNRCAQNNKRKVRIFQADKVASQYLSIFSRLSAK
jgi:glycosyltransferase involved in cell wall biosynthesis